MTGLVVVMRRLAILCVVAGLVTMGCGDEWRAIRSEPQRLHPRQQRGGWFYSLSILKKHREGALSVSEYR